MTLSKPNHAVLFSLLLALLFLWSPSPAEELKSTQAEGVAVILENNLAVARDAAVEDALRKSVEEAVGTMIDSQTLVENFQLVSDRIYSQAHGYIKGYRIVKEQRDDQLMRVRVEASVATGSLQDDLSALRILLTRVHKPRLMVLIEEKNLGADDQLQHWSDLSQVESVLTQKFLEKGFTFVDQAAVKRNVSRDQALLLIEGNEKGAKA
ncbi:MAG TPA: flagellar assembly protein T N-terminal domain-containing protein, partial [Candidatus Methylomirabilis sp.]